MGFAETGNALPVEARAVGDAPIPQWRWRRGNRADLSDLVFGGSGCVYRSRAWNAWQLHVRIEKD